jgi:phosphoglycolate phosphatase
VPVPPFPVYIFDVDGTLLDSAADICAAMREALAGTGRTDVPDSYLRGYIGHHLLDLYSDLFPEAPAERLDELILRYRTLFPLRQNKLTKVFPGVLETLEALEGRKTTATTKATRTTQVVLEQFGLSAFFSHIQGTDGFPAKPAPDVVLKAMEGLGAQPGDCLLVGDAATDMEAGRRAGVTLCAVRWGYGDHEKMARWEPDYWIDDIRELV